MPHDVETREVRRSGATARAATRPAATREHREFVDDPVPRAKAAARTPGLDHGLADAFEGREASLVELFPQPSFGGLFVGRQRGEAAVAVDAVDVPARVSGSDRLDVAELESAVMNAMGKVEHRCGEAVSTLV